MDTLRQSHLNKLEQLKECVATAEKELDDKIADKEMLGFKLSEVESERNNLTSEIQWLKELTDNQSVDIQKQQDELIATKTDLVTARGQLNQVTGRYLALERELDGLPAQQKTQTDAVRTLQQQLKETTEELAASRKDLNVRSP